jgi:GrpB-like predicted nucleotidyltransferase (UPF0157 family)
MPIVGPTGGLRLEALAADVSALSQLSCAQLQAHDRLILLRACQQVARLQEVAPGVALAVNVLPEYLHNKGFADEVRETLHLTGLPPHLLTLEIIERGPVELQRRYMLYNLTRLRLMGVQLALRRLHGAQKNSRPGHPTTCGKVERFQHTMKNWLRAQPDQPTTLTDLQTLLDRFLHTRVRHDRIDDTGAVTLHVHGRLHHIGIGQTHTRTRVLMLINDLHVRIINATTSELLRELTIGTTRDYQPRGLPPGPQRQRP